MNSWIIRGILAFLVLEAGVCTMFLSDAWTPLRKIEDGVFRALLGSTRNDRDFVLDDIDAGSGIPIGKPRIRDVRPLEPGDPQPYFQIGVVPESAPELETFPPSPVDWHLLLTNMHGVGCEVAAIEQPLTWDGEDLFRLATLETALRNFELVVLTVDLRRARTPQPIPGFLRSSAIPLSNVTGNLDRLVQVNRVIFPPSATGSGNTLFSFRLQESEKDLDPAFVRWGDYLIPSFPVAVAMAQHRVFPEEVRLKLGSHIRLGEGPVVPIDDYTQLRISPVENAQHAYLTADGIILQSQVNSARQNAGDSVPRVALFADGRADNPSPWLGRNRLQKLVSSFDVLPRPGEAERHLRLPVAAELAFLALIAVVAALLLTVRGFWRMVAFALVVGGSLGLLAAILHLSNKWTPFAPVLVAGLLGWFLCVRLSRYLPHPQPQAAPQSFPLPPSP